MKQNRSGAAKRSNNAKPSVRKTRTMFTGSALCLLTIGTISLCGMLGDKVGQSVGGDTAAQVDETTTVTESTQPDSEGTYTTTDTVAWRKASINEYEFAEVSAVGAKNSDKAEKKSENDKTAEDGSSSAETKAGSYIEPISSQVYYVKSPVNFRTDSRKSAEVLEVLDTGDSVVVDGVSTDGVWYSIQHGKVKGYAMAEYFTNKAPERNAEDAKAADEKNSVRMSEKKAVIGYTAEEFDMLCYVVQGEVGDCSEASKIAVANVIINRVKSEQFPDSIYDVLTSPSQFDAIYGYYDRSAVPSQNTIDCVARALAGEDNTNGATYYYAPQYCSGASGSWFESLELCLEVDGQRYFKNW